MHELVSSLKNDNDIQTLLQVTATIQDDIFDLNGRILAIKDLFQNVSRPYMATATSRQQVDARTPEVVVSRYQQHSRHPSVTVE